MTLKEAIESGRPFKRPRHGFWMFVKDNMITDCEDGEDYYLCVDDIIADDWEIKEEWYEGDFKEKYPNGVVCGVWNFDKDRKFKKKMVVVDYDNFANFPFVTDGGQVFKYAKPVKKHEAPAIIGDEL